MNALDVLTHMWEARLGDLPITAEGIATVVVIGLPAIVDDHGLKAALSAELALILDLLILQIL